MTMSCTTINWTPIDVPEGKNVKSVCLIRGRALRKLHGCVCESWWSTNSLLVLLSRDDTSGSRCTSRHTPESPARDSHAGDLRYRPHTHMRRRPTGGEKTPHAYTKKWPLLHRSEQQLRNGWKQTCEVQRGMNGSLR